ncbi:nitric oxide synthase [Deinococcus cavernae]|uniref:Nitric oxide synthase n=1 Tax=Deinococcus cavernae TaxID=2320857 RepID=A0A418UZB3_9DEIO|nr:nitric oxide synthase oxygenase [Deinococcus cavernae]RJF68861.1 nitric oxide synthase [Deinococcus cavernae]
MSGQNRGTTVQDFLKHFYAEESGQAVTLAERLIQAQSDLTLTCAELDFAAKVAWRNSTRCIGRLFWPALQVRDLRHVTQPDEVFQQLITHLQEAFCGGQIQSVISILSDEVRILNSQLIRYAGYEQPGGQVLGDPENLRLTRLAQRLGWEPSPPTAFDVLPLILQAGGTLHLYPLPPAAVQEVTITHPTSPQIAGLGLKWHALPAISDALLHVGETALPCVFNGWYMQTEIAARDLSDEGRYNVLPLVAQALALDTRYERTLWRDRALLELNVAVLHSFRETGIKIVDHHTAAAQFVRFQEREEQAGREVRGRWSWLISPMSPGFTGLGSAVQDPGA